MKVIIQNRDDLTNKDCQLLYGGRLRRSKTKLYKIRYVVLGISLSTYLSYQEFMILPANSLLQIFIVQFCTHRCIDNAGSDISLVKRFLKNLNFNLRITKKSFP